jgi:hypothetical protein
MKWTPKKKLQLMEAIQFRKKEVKSGISCVYFALNTKVGAKMYISEKIRDDTYRKQAHAAQYHLAPQVGDCFSFECFWIGHNPCSLPDVRHKVIYGYLTQNAIIEYPKKARKTTFNEEMWDLEMELRDIGIVNEDLGPNNVGFIGKRMVCIDFDYVSCHWKVGRKRKSKDATRT